LRISVRVEPRSSRNLIVGYQAGVLKVKLTSPPVGGEANEQLIEVLSDALGVRKSSIRIVKGHSSKNKIVEIDGIEGIPFKA